MYPGNHTDNVTAPRKWQSSPNSPPTQLAYVTKPEIDMLVDANIHGSMRGKPNRGPNGVMSLDGDYFFGGWEPVGGGSGSGSGGGSYGGGEDFGSPFGGGNNNPPSTVNEGNAPYVNEYNPDLDYLGGVPVNDLSNEEIAGLTGATFVPPADPGGAGTIEVYTPPEEIYGPGIAETGETVYNWEEMDKNNPVHAGVLSTVQGWLQDPTGSGIQTLEFYGIVQKNPYTGKYEWSPNSMNGTQLPAELINQIAEGSIVGGYEGEISDEPSTGTWDQIESPDVYGEHPMFPGGLEDYYDATDEPFVVPYTGGSGLGPSPGGPGWGSGGGGPGWGSGGGGRTPGFGGAFKGEDPWGLSQIQRAWINQLRGYNRGGIVSLC